jgi:hypothetical protein
MNFKPFLLTIGNVKVQNCCDYYRKINMSIVIFLLIERLEIEHVHLYLLGEQGLYFKGLMVP